MASGPLLSQEDISVGNTLSLGFQRLPFVSTASFRFAFIFTVKDNAVKNIRVRFWHLLYYHSCPMREHTFGNTFWKHILN